MHCHRPDEPHDPVVITGIGMIASTGNDRESVWRAVRQGRSGVRHLTGIMGIPDNLLVGAPVDIELEYPGQLKGIALGYKAASEAIEDSQVDLSAMDLDRFGCNISVQIGDMGSAFERLGKEHLLDPNRIDYWHQWLPNSVCSTIANRLGLFGPRNCHSVACTSGLIEVISAVRAIRDGQCDLVLAGSAEAIHPLTAAGFHKMRVLAHHEDPQQACRPFDAARSGFVLGEGSAMFVVERLSHAQARGAPIYVEIASGKVFNEAMHVTNLDLEGEALTHLISSTLRSARMTPKEITYINAHGTGTIQNDPAEIQGIRRAMGEAAEKTCISGVKSMLGHTINAAGSIELAITALSLRDGFASPTVNLTDPDPECNLDCVPLVGRKGQFECGLKLSLAFGGHLAAIALRRWKDTRAGLLEPARKVA